MILNGLDSGEFFSYPKEGTGVKKLGVKEKLIVYLGRISPRKGVDHLISAFQPKARSNVSLAIAGNDMGGLQKAKELATTSRIRFLGTLGGEDRLQALCRCRYPGLCLKEIFGLVPFEGLLTGSPVIVSDDCGCGHYIRSRRWTFSALW